MEPSEQLPLAIAAITHLKVVIALMMGAATLLWLIPPPEYCHECPHCRNKHAEEARLDKIKRHKNHHIMYPFIERGDKEHCPYCAEGVD